MLPSALSGVGGSTVDRLASSSLNAYPSPQAYASMPYTYRLTSSHSIRLRGSGGEMRDSLTRTCSQRLVVRLSTP